MWLKILIPSTIFAIGFLFIHSKLKSIMANIEEFKAALADINDATNNIADDLTRLADKIAGAGGDLTADEEKEILDSLKASAEKLKGIAALNAEETPAPTENPDNTAPSL